MGMPALVYRLWFAAHSLKSFRRNILSFCGIGPVRTTLFGGIEILGDARRRRWLEQVRKLGQRARVTSGLADVRKSDSMAPGTPCDVWRLAS